LQSLKRLISEDSLAIILVEQHAKVALSVTESAIVLNRGRITHSGSSAGLLNDPQKLTSLIVAQ
jgi:branched-chain amino acid transport system ATP-binding protein